MPLIVEDGTGIVDAESYLSVATFRAYYDARYTLPAGVPNTDADVEKALRRATPYLDGTYSHRWPGYRTYGRLQALDWPRTNAYDVERNLLPSDEVPIEVIHACAEAAKRELENPGTTSPDVTTSRQVLSETVGPISRTFAATGSSSSMRPQLKVIDDLLSSLLAGVNSRTRFLSRA